MQQRVYSAIALATLFTFMPLAHAAFSPGDILIDYFAAGPNLTSNIHQYSPTGSLVSIFSASGTSEYRGATITSAGDLLTTDELKQNGPATANGFLLFSPDGVVLQNQTLPQINPATSVAGIPAVFNDGTIVIPDQLNPAIRLYSPNGTYLGAITDPSITHPIAPALASDNSMWIANSLTSPIVHISENGSILGSFPISFDPDALVTDPADGSLWLTADDGKVHHLSTTGTELGSFSVPLITLAPPPNVLHGPSIPGGIAFASAHTLYVDGTFDPNLYHYSTDGTLLGSFPIDPPGFVFTLTVVPLPEPRFVPFACLIIFVFHRIGRRSMAPRRKPLC